MTSWLGGADRASSPEREIAEGLEPLLSERLLHARRAWPNVQVGVGHFVDAIMDRIDKQSAVRSLAAMHTDDLYLACGCARADRAALAAFEERCSAAISRAIATAGAPSSEHADLGQVVRERLLVVPADAAVPRIATYSARAPLPTWVRIVAIRETVRTLQRARREVAVVDETLMEVIAADDDPEVHCLKGVYRQEFKRAFHTVVEALDSRDRLILRQYVLDGFSIDQLARLHGVHRATAARWVQSARDAVLTGTQRELMRRLGIGHDELASLMCLFDSELDLSVPRALRQP